MKRDYQLALINGELLKSPYLDREFASIMGKLDLLDALLNADTNLIDLEDTHDEKI